MLRIKYKSYNRVFLLFAAFIFVPLFITIPIASAYNSDCDQTTCSLTCNDGTTTTVVAVGTDYYTNATGGKTADQFCSSHNGIQSILRLDGKPVAHSGGNGGSTVVQCQTQNGKNYCSAQCGGSYTDSKGVFHQEDSVQTSINIGCKGHGNPIIDMLFAIIRLLSYGVGLIIVASMVIAGIQYTTSRGDPQATAAAENRIKTTLIALFIFIFAYAILNYIIPAGVLGTK